MPGSGLVGLSSSFEGTRHLEIREEVANTVGIEVRTCSDARDALRTLSARYDGVIYRGQRRRYLRKVHVDREHRAVEHVDSFDPPIIRGCFDDDVLGCCAHQPYEEAERQFEAIGGRYRVVTNAWLQFLFDEPRTSAFMDGLVTGSRRRLAVPPSLKNDLRLFLEACRRDPKLAEEYLPAPEPASHVGIALGQHYCLPTYYLDFTYDPDVAIYFAVAGCEGRSSDLHIVYEVDVARAAPIARESALRWCQATLNPPSLVEGVGVVSLRDMQSPARRFEAQRSCLFIGAFDPWAQTAWWITGAYRAVVFPCSPVDPTFETREAALFPEDDDFLAVDERFRKWVAHEHAEWVGLLRT